MFVRINAIYGDQDKIDAGIEHIEGADRAAVATVSGNRGLATFVDRDAGVIVAASYWDEPLSSSDAVLTRAREGAVAAAGGALVTESYEVAAGEPLSVPGPGAAIRLTRMRLDIARVADGIRFYREEILPELLACAGLCTAQMLIDRASGAGIALTAWKDDDAAARAGTVLRHLRDRAIERLGVTFPRVERYTMIRSSVRLN